MLVDNPPENIDILLMEGTTIGRETGPRGFPSEDDLEQCIFGKPAMTV
jgi:hypothetical protein